MRRSGDISENIIKKVTNEKGMNDKLILKMMKKRRQTMTGNGTDYRTLNTN